MAQNEPQRKETPPGPSPNSPSLLFEFFEYQCRSGKFIRLANRIESKKNRFGGKNRIETFLPELECSTVQTAPYLERLQQLKLPTLKYSQLRGNMIEVLR